MAHQTTPETILLDSHVEQRERGLVEAVLRSEVHLKPATGEVLLIVKRGLCNPNLPNKGTQDQEVSRRTLAPNEVTDEIREKIKALKMTGDSGF